MNRELRIIFMGTPEFAVGVLDKIIEANHNVVGVVTAPDRPSGRGRKTTPSAVKKYAEEKNLPVLQPPNLKDENFIETLKEFRANLFVVVAFRMLPKVVWEIPEYGTFNLHASLLPEYRGAAPINWAIINGENQTGVTTFFIDEKIDTGEIILSKEVKIEERETASSLHDKLMIKGALLVADTLDMIAKNEVKTIKQPQNIKLKEAPKLTNENTKIDWSLKGAEIDQFIRGLSSYPGAWSILYNGQEALRTKIYSAHYEPASHSYEFGRIETNKKEIKVAVRDGYIFLEMIQFPNKRKMDTINILNGFTFEEDAKFA